MLFSVQPITIDGANEKIQVHRSCMFEDGISALVVLKFVTKVQLNFKIFKKYNQVLKFSKSVFKF